MDGWDKTTKNFTQAKILSLKTHFVLLSLPVLEESTNSAAP